MADPVDELEFLSRSKHRIRLMQALQEPCSRSTLRERTVASKPTLSRALREFEGRKWVIREGNEYRLTHLGELVVEGLKAALQSLETAEKLGPVAEWLPAEEFGFGFERLHDAAVYTASPADTLGPLRRLGSLLYDAEEVRELTGIVASNGIDVHRRAIANHDQTLEAILTADALQAVVSDSEMASIGVEVHEADGVSLFRYDGTVPFFLALTEDRTLIGVLDDSGTVRGLVESRDASVRAWATRTWDEYRTAAIEIESLDS